MLRAVIEDVGCGNVGSPFKLSYLNSLTAKPLGRVLGRLARIKKNELVEFYLGMGNATRSLDRQETAQYM